jgi:hypothetical protein
LPGNSCIQTHQRPDAACLLQEFLPLSRLFMVDILDFSNGACCFCDELFGMAFLRQLSKNKRIGTAYGQ